MKRAACVAVALSAVLGASCASVPNDAGLTEVQQAISTRAGQQVTQWDGEAPAANDERIRTLLQDDLTADDAVAIAMASNPRLQITLAELGIARADLIEASTISNPLLEFEIRFPGDPFQPYELRLAQSLIDLIQLPQRRALGRAAFDAAQLRVTSAVLQFASDVRMTYYELIAATRQAAMSREIAEAAQAAAELALAQHAAENITDLDFENEQSMYEEAKLDLARANQRALLAREALLRALSLRETPFELRLPDGFPDLPAAEPDQQQLESRASEQRLDIVIARRAVEIAERQIPISRLAMLQGVELDVHYEREPDGAETAGPGIEVPIPIFDTGRGARTRAEAQFVRARHELSALLTESASRLRSAAATVAEARARVEYFRDVILPRRRRIVELTKLEHNAMLVGFFQLLQASQNEVQARQGLIGAQHDYWMARTELDGVLNGISSDAFTVAEPKGERERPNSGRGGH